METVRIGVVGDTHGHVANVVEAINRIKPLDFIIHLGDYAEDGPMIEEAVGIEVIGVKGNCDFNSTLPEDRLLTIGGKKIFITHGHRYDVKHTYHKIFYKALEVEADVVLFGHTHMMARFVEDDILIMNPGSVSHPRGHLEKTFALLEIGKEVVSEILIIS
ncbi:MAG: metallophosphoesterase [Clostridia bacterium]|nr:metallophosphoesterase [Clostridia bacterium]